MLTTYLVPKRYFYLTSCRLVRRPHFNTQPGADYQINEFKDAANELLNDPEAFESDFMNVHKSHREHLHELVKQREKVRHLMIKHKYFREPKLPNLLTFEEKEQMRNLHTQDPEEWTFEKLAESFPATTEIVKKVLQAKWRPHSIKRIRKHNEAVIKNWEQLRSGKLDAQLTPELKEHVQKFAARKLNDLIIPAEELYKRPELPEPKTKEFQNIITSCVKYAEETQKSTMKMVAATPKTTTMTTTIQKSVPNKQNERQKFVQPIKPSENDTYLLSAIKDKREMRFEDLKKLKFNNLMENNERTQMKTTAAAATTTTTEKLQESAHKLNELPANTAEKTTTTTAAIDYNTNAKEIQAIAENSNRTGLFNFAQKFESSEIVISADDCKRYEITKVKDRIYIPRKIWKRNKLYRVEDCYYDDNGELLYRVPGMTN